MTPQTIAIIILAVIIIVLVVMVISLHSKLRRFLVGSQSKDIAESLMELKKNTEELSVFRDDIQDYLKSVEKRLRRSVQSVHTVRYNPFKGTGSGGNQSFATALLTEAGDGVVLSSLHSREHVSIFSKPIKGKKPEFDLSEEELAAFNAALLQIQSSGEKK